MKSSPTAMRVGHLPRGWVWLGLIALSWVVVGAAWLGAGSLVNLITAAF